MLVQRPQGNEALRGIDGYEQMVNTFAKNAKAIGDCGAASWRPGRSSNARTCSGYGKIMERAVVPSLPPTPGYRARASS